MCNHSTNLTKEPPPPKKKERIQIWSWLSAHLRLLGFHQTFSLNLSSSPFHLPSKPLSPNIHRKKKKDCKFANLIKIKGELTCIRISWWARSSDQYPDYQKRKPPHRWHCLNLHHPALISRHWGYQFPPTLWLEAPKNRGSQPILIQFRIKIPKIQHLPRKIKPNPIHQSIYN